MAFKKEITLPEMLETEDTTLDIGNGFRADYKIGGGYDSNYDDAYDELTWPTTITIVDNNNMTVATIEGPDFQSCSGEDSIIETNRKLQEDSINDILTRLPEIIREKIAENEKQNESLTSILDKEPKSSSFDM